jgi:hypothetical protein
MRNSYKILVRILKRKDQLGNLSSMGRRIILKWNFLRCGVDWIQVVRDQSQGRLL